MRCGCGRDPSLYHDTRRVSIDVLPYRLIISTAREFQPTGKLVAASVLLLNNTPDADHDYSRQPSRDIRCHGTGSATCGSCQCCQVCLVMGYYLRVTRHWKVTSLIKRWETGQYFFLSHHFPGGFQLSPRLCFHPPIPPWSSSL